MQDDNKEGMKKAQLSIELPEDIAEGIYSNFAVISHSSSEFVIDFLRIMPNSAKAKVKSRIVLSPEHAKRLQRALLDNIEKYESQFGSVEKKENGYNPPFPINLSGTGEA